MIRIVSTVIVILYFVASATAQTGGKVARFVVAPIKDMSSQLTVTQHEILRARLEDALLSTGTFEVDTRLAREAELLLNEAELAKRLGQTNRPPDFLLVLDVDGFTLSRRATIITAMPDRYNTFIDADIAVRARVLSARTGELKRSFELDESFRERLGVKHRSDLAPNSTLGGSMGEFITPATDRDFVTISNLASDALAERLFEDLYPAEIMVANGTTVYISRGFEGGYSVGDEFKVFSGDGEELIHPVTGEILGTAEVQLATVIIDEVRDDFSIGTLNNVTGNVNKGALVRR